MNFTDIFIKRPVLASVISLLILLMGTISYKSMNVRQFPEIQTSVISIHTAYIGASPELMQGFVSTPIENAIATVDGIDYITSSNSQGDSSINIYLKDGYDIDTIINDVSSKVDSIRKTLPKDIENPVIAKEDPNARPTLFIAFSSDNLSAEAITDYLVRVIVPQVGAIDGVGQSRIFGERQYAMRVWLDPYLMKAHNITAGDITTRLSANNIPSAAGSIKSEYRERDVTATTDLHTAEQFNDLILKQEDGSLLRLRDIGQAQLGPLSSDKSSTFINGKRTVVIGVIPKSTANPLVISEEFKKVLPRIQESLPHGLNAYIVWDSSKFIKESINEVYKTLFEACLFVIIVIFLFLGSVRAVFIPTVTIPVSIIGVCTIMLALNFTINTITLLACVLAIGMVVDDAIVVLENIHRHMEKGMKPLQAALEGAKQIRFAVISMTFTLAAVYAPIGFVGGLTGSLFKEFAFALAGAVIVSGLVALTLSPMLCSKILRIDPNPQSFSHKIDVFTDKLKHRYKHFLVHTIFPKRKVVLGIALVTYVLCAVLWMKMPQELAPIEDQGALMGMAMGPTNANLKYTEKYSAEVAKIFESVPEKDGYVIINGFPGGPKSMMSFLILKPWEERKRTTNEIKQSLFPMLWSIPGFNAFMIDLPPLPVSGGNTPVDFVLKTTGSNPRDLNNAMQTLIAAARQNPGFINPDTNLKLNKPVVKVIIDRNKAGDLGVSMSEISSALNWLLAEPRISNFSLNGRSYYVVPQLDPEFRKTPENLNNIYVRTQSNELTPLSNLVRIEKNIGPESLYHFQQQNSAELTATLAPGYTLGEALKFLVNIAKTQLPNDIQYDFSGQSRQFLQASGQMAQIFIFAVIFIYLILAAQFESFRDPLIVMTCVPLSLTGALITMKLTGSTMNIYTQIGLVTLIGLISKHGILMVEFANQLQEEGKSKIVAIVQAATTRLRPILMTTAAMILGAFPLAIASGAGAASRSQMGWVIVGGMSFGTLLTLFVLPVVYSLFAEVKKPAEEEKEKTEKNLASQM